jgi:hypothetical protein
MNISESIALSFEVILLTIGTSFLVDLTTVKLKVCFTIKIIDKTMAPMVAERTGIFPTTPNG